MSGFVVVDTSLVVKWLIEEDDSDTANALLQYWENEGMTRVAPYLMLFEVANVLHRRVEVGELSVGQSARMMERLLGSRLELLHPTGLHTRALELASMLGQGAVYDSHYLALAEILGCEYWTADRRFYRGASAVARNVRWIGEFVAPG